MGLSQPRRNAKGRGKGARVHTTRSHGFAPTAAAARARQAQGRACPVRSCGKLCDLSRLHRHNALQRRDGVSSGANRTPGGIQWSCTPCCCFIARVQCRDWHVNYPFWLCVQEPRRQAARQRSARPARWRAAWRLAGRTTIDNAAAACLHSPWPSCWLSAGAWPRKPRSRRSAVRPRSLQSGCALEAQRMYARAPLPRRAPAPGT